jgi:putative ABC transport system permease protein
VDTTFFDVFKFPVVQGDGKRALKNVNGILISESTAKKYFGEESPIGKQLIIYPDSALLEVMAVFRDVPEQSHFHFDFLVSYVREKSFDPEDEYYSWADFGHFNYIRLKPGADAKAFEKKLLPWVRKYIHISDQEMQQFEASHYGFRVQPVTGIHLKSHLRWELEPNGNIEYVYIMAAAALLTLIIACINFMNLMTARSTERAREIGIRKTLGALRHQLSAQFLMESVTLTIISILVGVLLVEISLPFYKEVTGDTIQLSYWEVVPALAVLGLAIGIGAGLYPSLVLSTIRPFEVLKGKFYQSSKGSGLRNGLIVFQFTMSMILICGAIVINKQLNYIQDKNLGFGHDQVLVVPMKNENLTDRFESLRTELEKINGVYSVSASSNLPGGQFNQNSISTFSNPQNELTCSEIFVDYDFLNAMGLTLADGRFFTEADLRDTTFQFVLNETAANQLNERNIVGKEINWHLYDEDQPIRGRVAGVVKDFHFQSLHEPLRPLILVQYPAYNHLIIKLNPENFQEKLANITRVYKQFETNFEFEFTFLDNRLHQQYEVEQRSSLMFNIFSFIAISVACFGLFGIATLSFSQRTKEVSVRKVLGSTEWELTVLLLRDFSKLIAIAVLIASPVAWWIMDQWLDNFIYQTDIPPTIFVYSGLGLMAMAWLTLGYLTFKTARVNPAESLKAE